MANHDKRTNARTKASPEMTSGLSEYPMSEEDACSEDFTFYPIHTTCASCKHYHRHKTFKIFKDPERRSSLHCERCEKPLFGVGRSDTQVTFASGESRPPQPLHLTTLPQRNCTNRLRKKTPSRLSTMELAPSSLEYTAHVPRRPSTHDVCDGLPLDSYETQGKASNGSSSQVVAVGKKWSRRRLFGRGSKFRRFFALMGKKLYRHSRWKTPPEQASPTAVNYSSKDGSNNEHVNDLSLFQKGATHKCCGHSHCTPSSEAPHASPSPPLDAPNRNTSSPPRDTDVVAETRDSNRASTALRLKEHRRKRTILTRRATVVLCDCAEGCQCMHTTCACREAHDMTSDASSSQARRSPPPADDVPGHLLNRVPVGDADGNGYCPLLPSRSFPPYEQFIGLHLEGSTSP